MASPGVKFMEEHQDFVLKLKIKACDGELEENSLSNSVTRLSRILVEYVRVICVLF
jgi:hypothetical protein